VSSAPDAATARKSGNVDKSPIRRLLNRRLGGKEIWDWFSVLAVPVAILAATIWFTGWQSYHADLQNQDDIVETYISDMNALLSQGLSASKPGDHIRQVATEETVTTLPRLNAQHNETVIQFLQKAQLIGTQDTVINLDDADLSHADLAGADLSGVTMYGADLAGASLSGATLTGATLSDAILTDADLSGARLGSAILSSTSLSGANLGGANLAAADLTGADITQPQLDDVGSCTSAILPTGLTCRPLICSSRINIIPCQQRPPIQLTYWYTESDNEKGVIINLINQFNQQNPGIHVTGVQKSFFQARAAFTAAAQDGNAPDVFRSDIGWTTLFASDGYLLNIDSYVSQSDLDLSDYRSAPLSASLGYDMYKGHLYGLPQVTDFLALLYNKNELAKAGITGPPHTMAHFETDAKTVVEKKRAKYGFETGGTFYSALPFLYAYGGGMFDQHNKIIVHSDGSVRGLDFLLNLENSTNHAMPSEVDLSNGPSNMVPDFMKGTTAMIFDGPYDVKEILTGSSFKNHRNLGIAAIPTGAAGQTGRSPLGGQSYVISARTAYPAQAYKFIEFMSSTANQMKIAEANHTLPTLRSAYKGKVCKDPFISEFLRIKDTAVARPPITQGAYLFDVADPSIWAALSGSLSGPRRADHALNAVADSWNQLGAGTLPQSTLTPGTSPTACS